MVPPGRFPRPCRVTAVAVFDFTFGALSERVAFMHDGESAEEMVTPALISDARFTIPFRVFLPENTEPGVSANGEHAAVSGCVFMAGRP
jgi:hypothetical protein